MFKELGAAASGKALRQAVGVAITPILKEARAKAPKGNEYHRTYKGRLVAPGFLSRSIGKKTWLSKHKHFALATVSPLNEGFYGKFFSSSVPRPFAVSRKTSATRSFPEDDFLVEAFESKKQEAVAKFNYEIGKKLDKALQKTRRK